MSSPTLEIDQIRPQIESWQHSLENIIKGKRDRIQLALICLLARGHVLLEDVPGVGKTTLAHLVAASIDCSFKRVQFTSDLLPSDVLGVTIFNREANQFEFKQGPIFCNILLADEVNRSTPKTQSCLLEAMSASAVSIENQTHLLPQPFMVIATQNPVEIHGTFPLPESQLDRFMMRLTMGYPGKDAELELLKEQAEQVDFSAIEPVMHGDEVIKMQQEVINVKVTDELLGYIVSLVEATRQAADVELGVSTRGALALRDATKARAYYFGRDYAVPDDVKELAPYVLSHRLQMAETFDRDEYLGGENERRDELAIKRLLSELPVPV